MLCNRIGIPAVIKKLKCPCCDGSGEELDPEVVGREMRRKRVTSHPALGVREMAGKLGLSHTYLTLLEQGKRKWTPTLRHDYLNEIGK